MNEPPHERSGAHSGKPDPMFHALFSRRRWSLVPRQSLFLLSALPLALAIPVAVIFLVSVGAGLLVAGVGLVLLVGATLLSRWFGALELRRLVWAGAGPIEPPLWPHPTGEAWFRRAATMLLDRRQWTYVAYSVLYLPLGTLTGSLALVWIASIIGGATRWIWNGWVPPTAEELKLIGWFAPELWPSSELLAGPLPIIANAAFGALALITLPWLTGAMVGLHDRLARVFLSRYSPDEIEAQMQGLRRSRHASVAAEGRALRKLERDLHDGPQQQLLRLQLDLAAAQRKMKVDPETASRMIEDAGRRSADTLAELRHLVRGIAPPILQDRGLMAALQALAERNPIPTRVSGHIDPMIRIEPAVQQGVYFMVSELLANSVKHSGAKNIAITCAADSAARMLKVTVDDDGKGGADAMSGRGLAGIGERMEGLGGTWHIESPPGGPTTVTLSVPTDQE